MAIDQLSSMYKNRDSEQEDMINSGTIVESDDGGMEMLFEDEAETNAAEEGEEQEFYRNIAEELGDDELSTIAEEVLMNFDADKQSRAGWERTITKGLSLLGLELEELSEPYEGACSAHHPLIIESAVKFQAKASPELLPSNGPVRTQILGTITPEKEAKAERIKNFLNYQIMCQMHGYYEDTEKMLFWLPILGSTFKKAYYSPTLKRPVSEYVPCDQFVVPFSATNLESAPRYSHLIYKTENDLRKDMASGMYRKLDLDDLVSPSRPNYSDIRTKVDSILGLSPSSDEEAYTLIEQHVELDLSGEFADKDGIALPYVVTVDQNSREVLSIRRNWKSEDDTRQKRMWFVHYPFVPGLGFYGVGFIHLLGNLEMTLTTVLRALVDSGQFANMQGGFKLKGMRIAGDNQAIAPGEWKEVEAAVMDLSKSIMPLPYKEPSAVLFAMLEFLEGRGQKFADSTEQVIADSTNYGPVGTTMALLEASTKFFTAVHKRSHFAQKREFKILVDINSETLPDEYPYDVPGESRSILSTDFDGSIDVLPVSDPNVSSKAQRVTTAQTVVQIAQQFPQVHDIKAVLRHFYSTMGVDNYERFLPAEEEAVQNDPITDIQFATLGKPIKAYTGQNHDAHIQIKSSFLQDPLNGGSPFMQQAAPVLMANIREHMILKYQEQIGGMVEQQTNGQSVDEATVEMVMAEAAQMIMQTNMEQEKQKGISDPERMVAEAELIKAKAQENRVKIEQVDKMTKNSLEAKSLELQKLSLFEKAASTDAKLKNDLQKQAMKDGSKMVLESLLEQRHVDKVKAKEKPPVAGKPKK